MNDSNDHNEMTQDQEHFIRGKLRAVIKEIRGYL
jgi:hypothetical protein